jgi:hypothetical protein
MSQPKSTTKGLKTCAKGLVALVIKGESSAARYADKLVHTSKWFMVTPMPDGKWEFMMKDEPGIPDA